MGEPGSGRWRLEKAGRIALSDGERILMWSPEINSGFIMRPGSGAIEDFATLLDPYTLLLREELNFAERRNASYSKQVGPETITLTVEAPAEGDFSNDYLSGTSIDESDTRREYRFDRTTGRLIGLKIEQTDGKTPVTIAELQRIVYDIPLSDTLFRAYDGIEWIDLTKPVGGVHFAAIAPEEAARTLFANTRRRTRFLSARPYEGTICRLPPPRNPAGLPFGTVRGSIRSLPSENVRRPHRKNSARSAQ